MPTGDLAQQPEAYPETRRSYVLRLWKERPDAAWRGELQNVSTGEEHRFNDLDSLIAFLRDEDTEWSGP